MNKVELIEKLYKEGKISFGDALILSDSSKEDLTRDNIIKKANEFNSKESILDDFLYEIVEEYYDDEISKDENLAFDSQKCVDYMDDSGWQWQDSDVTLPRFKEALKSNIREVINGVIANYKNDVDKENGYYWSVEGGGIRVEGWIEDDMSLVIRPMFVIEDSHFYLDREKSEILLK